MLINFCNRSFDSERLNSFGQKELIKITLLVLKKVALIDGTHVKDEVSTKKSSPEIYFDDK